LLLRGQPPIPHHPVLASRRRPLSGAGALVPHQSQAKVPLEGSARLLVAEVLAVRLRHDGPVGPDPVEQDVAVLVVPVAVSNDHVLKAIEVMAPPLQVFVRRAAHLLFWEGPVVVGEAQGHVLDGLADIGPLLPDGLELPCELSARAAGHVAADDLRLMVGVETAAFVEHVARGTSEAAASGDLGNHESPPSGVSVGPRPSARTVPRNRVTSSRASRPSRAPESRRRSAMPRAMTLTSAASRPRA